MEETNSSTSKEPVSKGNQKKPRSAGNKNFRKHNKLGFYRFMQRKKKIPGASKTEAGKV